MRHVNTLFDLHTLLIRPYHALHPCKDVVTRTFRRLALVITGSLLLAFTFGGSFANGQTVISAPIAQVYAGGTVGLIARQSDGKVIIAGYFSYVNGVRRNGLARLNTDGSLDTTWNPNPYGSIDAILIDSANNLYVGGSFSSIGGQATSGLVRLSSSGAVDSTWNPSPSSSSFYLDINALTLDPVSGYLYVGGSFTSIGGQAMNNIARLSTSGGGADPTWNPNPNQSVSAIVTDNAGNVYTSGSFTTIGGLQRNYIAKISGAGVVDPLWDPSPSGITANTSISHLALDPLTGNVYAGGMFQSIGGQSISNLAKLSSTGTGAAITSWNPQINSSINDEVNALAVDTYGNVYVSGQLGNVGGLTRNAIKLSGTTAVVDPNWNPLGYWVTNTVASVGLSPIYAFAFDDNDNALVGGSFTYIGGLIKTGFAVLASGTAVANPAWPSVQVGGTINALVRDSVGRTVIGGNFTFMGDAVTVRTNIARLNSDTTIDTSWDPEANAEVDVLALDSGGNVYAAGQFTAIGGQARNYLAHLSVSDGSADSWNPSPGGYVTALALDDTSGNLFVGGNYSIIGAPAQERVNLAKISVSSGSADATWNPGVTQGWGNAISALALDGSGNLYAGGTYVSIGGISRAGLAKLSTSGVGAVDVNWNPNPSQSGGNYYNSIGALTLDGSGNLYVGGNFTSIGGQNLNSLARISATSTGAADAIWNPNADGEIDAIVLDGNGHVYVGGNFIGENPSWGTPVFGVGGAIRTYLARLFVSGAGNADCNWIANASTSVATLTPVSALALDSNNNLYVGGGFSQIDGSQQFGFAELTGSTTAGCQLGITAVNSGINPSANYPFGLTVQSQDSTGMPQTVVSNTIVTQSVDIGTGTLSGTTSCQINAGGYTCTMPGLLYSNVESGVVLTSTSSSGDTLASANSAPLNFIAARPPTQLSVLNVNGGVNPVAGTGFPITVQALDISGLPANVTTATTVGVWASGGTGVVTNTYQSCQINVGTNSCTMTGVTYSKAESGIIFTAGAYYGTGYIAGNSQPITINEPPGGKTLTVIQDVAGEDTITTTPAGINCSSGVCTAVFPTGSSVNLQYTAGANTLVNWIGDCSSTTPTCTLTMDSDKVVSINTAAASRSAGYTTTTAYQCTTTVVGTANQSNDQTQTQILGSYKGSIVYDQSFSAPFSDTSVQAGVAAADNAIRVAAQNEALVIGAPVLTGTSNTALFATSYSDAVTESYAINTGDYIGPQAITVGNLGNCVLAPTNCTGPVPTLTIPAGAADYNTMVVAIINTSRTIVNTTTNLFSSTYLVSDGVLSNDANLSALVVSSGDLSPVFAPGTLNYTDSVSNVTSITLTPTLDDPTASVLVNGVSAVSDSASAAIPLVAGNNVITIDVTAQDGAMNIYTITVTLKAADFTGSPTSGEVPLNVIFADASTNSPTSWAWNFGDGDTSTQKSPVHTYLTDGTYTVTLTATGSGCASTMTKTGYVTVSGTCINPPYMIQGITCSYPTIQAAYEAMGDETMQLQALEFTGGLVLDQSKTVTLQGGFGCDFTSNPGYTIVSGKLTIEDGTVTIDNLIIQ
jgi:hypothetical protein